LDSILGLTGVKITVSIVPGRGVNVTPDDTLETKPPIEFVTSIVKLFEALL